MISIRTQGNIGPIWVRPFLLFASTGLLASTGCDDPEVGPDTIEKARGLTGQYQKALKAELTGAMGKGGPTAAIAVCSEKAPAIGKQVARGPDTKDWRVSRTALRLRNPDNRPSAIERQGLEKLSQRLSAGEPVEQVHFTAAAGDQFVFMLPIMTGDVCLTCHGKKESIAPEVQKKLRTLYPGDEATGFSPGDLRGAFVVTGPLDD